MKYKTGDAVWSEREFDELKRVLIKQDIDPDSGRYIYLVYNKGKMTTLFSRKRIWRKPEYNLIGWVEKGK